MQARRRQMAAMLAAGKTVDDVMAAFNVSEYTVNRAWREAGLNPTCWRRARPVGRPRKEKPNAGE